MGLIRYPTIRYNWVHVLLASNSARYIHCYWSILGSMKCFCSNSAGNAVESLGVSGIAAPSLNPPLDPSSPLKFPFSCVFDVILVFEVLKVRYCYILTVKTFGLLEPHYGCRSCMPVVYVIHYKLQGRLPISF